MRILVTGGAGYIGSQTCLELLRAGHKVCIIDNLTNGNFEAVNRIRRLSNCDVEFHENDIRNFDAMSTIIGLFKPDTVIHFAGLKSVGESLAQPAMYYDINVGGTAVLLSAMEKVGCYNIVFSSSATVYGEPKYLPCDEKHPLEPINPYGRSKLMAEQLLIDWVNVLPNRNAVALRYFNPVGADPSGLLGEDPNGTPANLMPFLAQVAGGRLDCLQVFGNDYPTADGTGVRDYIHVVDLARAHVAAVEKIIFFKGFEAINVGTGRGISVLDLINEFEIQSGQKINFKYAQRRKGDAPEVWANSSLAFSKLGFSTRFGISEMCNDTWSWQLKNPTGYSNLASNSIS